MPNFIVDQPGVLSEWLKGSYKVSDFFVDRCFNFES